MDIERPALGNVRIQAPCAARVVHFPQGRRLGAFKGADLRQGW
jgi:hypothetical protein